ncbi:MAG: glycosyltransferase family 39 protein [Syntrophaceae bacterium]|nr:glycosyltransferase family 39 protein [Syntrophaceae bacterium]
MAQLEIKNEKINLAILFLLSVTLSLYLFFRTYVISLDGAFQYIPIAKDFASGLFGKALTHTQQPLYSFLIAMISPWVSDYELAGKWVSTFLGIFMIFPVYFLGKRIFDERIAFLSTLLLVIHPFIRRVSAEVLKESTYLFFLAIALWFTWRTIERGKKFSFLFIPLFSTLAYLVRPDGIEVLFITFFYVLFIKKFNGFGNKWRIVLLMILSSLLLFLPYLIHIRGSTGMWTLSKVKTVGGFLGLQGIDLNVPFIDKILFSLKRLNLEILFNYHPLYLFLFAIGFIKGASSHFKQGEKYLLSFLIVHYIVLFFLVFNITDWSDKGEIQFIGFSGRHVLPLLLFSIYWVGEGVLVVYQWIFKQLESHHKLFGLEATKRSQLLWVILFIIILGTILPKTLKSHRYERLPEKWAGVWIKDQSGGGATLLTTLPRVAFYAGVKYELIDFKNDSLDQIKISILKGKAFYLVIRGKDLFIYPELSESINKSFIEAVRYEEKGMDKVIVYKRVR